MYVRISWEPVKNPLIKKSTSGRIVFKLDFSFTIECFLERALEIGLDLGSASSSEASLVESFNHQ